jgi:hypothetical protein
VLVPDFSGYGAETFHYNDAGALEWFTKRNGEKITISRDAMMRPTGIVAPGVVGQSVGFTLDAIGRVKRAWNGSSSSEYSYAAPSGRLDGVHVETHNMSAEGYAFDSAFTYDDNGNIRNITATLPRGVSMCKEGVRSCELRVWWKKSGTGTNFYCFFESGQ